MERFSQLVAQGDVAVADAYSACYPASESHSARANGCRLSKRPEVASEIQRLQKLSEGSAVLSLVQRRCILRAIAEDAEQPPAARVSALALDSRLSGDLDDRPQANVAVGISLSALFADEADGEPLRLTWADDDNN
ncbi:MAG: hypothetical protein O3C21_15370 [Verrucomicrobia bacterium]|nr:hypothetical protein [Verrucomicrobiota bacterium]